MGKALKYWDIFLFILQIPRSDYDIKEAHDLAKKYPEKTKELARLLTQKLKAENAQMPIVKATGKPVPYPGDIK